MSLLRIAEHSTLFPTSKSAVYSELSWSHLERPLGSQSAPAANATILVTQTLPSDALYWPILGAFPQDSASKRDRRARPKMLSRSGPIIKRLFAPRLHINRDVV